MPGSAFARPEIFFFQLPCVLDVDAWTLLLLAVRLSSRGFLLGVSIELGHAASLLISALNSALPLAVSIEFVRAASLSMSPLISAKRSPFRCLH